jgi:hypothetical protein
MFKNFYVGCGSRTPESYSVGLDWSIALNKRSLLFVESFDFRPSNQNILVRAIPSCYRFSKMCLCQVSLMSRYSPRYLTLSFLGELHIVCLNWGGGHVSFRVVSVTWIDLHPLAFMLHFLN